MAATSWLDHEPSAGAALAIASRLLLAGLARSVVFALLGALYAAALAGAVLWTKYTYTPEYILRLVEADRDPGSMPRPQRDLAEHVRQAVFTSEPLLDIVRRYGLYPSLASRNPRAALESFREDIDVDVYQNYFLEERPVGAAPRSARLTVSYRAGDADTAVHVTRELGELVVNRERAEHADEARRAAELAREEVDEAREALALRRATVASLRDELDHDPRVDPERRVAYIGLLGSLPSLEQMQDAREQRAASLSLGAALEKRGIGTTFEVVDDGQLPTGAAAKSGRVFTAGAAFALGLPLIALAIGAFSPRKARP